MSARTDALRHYAKYVAGLTPTADEIKAIKAENVAICGVTECA